VSGEHEDAGRVLARNALVRSPTASGGRAFKRLWTDEPAADKAADRSRAVRRFLG